MSEPSSVTTMIPDFQTAIARLAEIARAKGDDFRMKVLRKVSQAAPLSTIATFDGATVEHFQTPEAWLVPFCGGGPIYVLWAYHASDPNVLLVTVMPPLIHGAPREPDLSLVRATTWNGPRILISPRPPDAPAASPSADLSALFPGSGAGRTGSGGPAREVGTTTGPAAGPGSSSEEERLNALRLSILDQQRRSDTERIEKMIEAQAKATERQITALSSLIEKVATRPAEPKAAEKPLAEQLAPLIVAAAPILTAFLARGSEDRKEMLAREAAREEREAKRSEENLRMIIAMSEKSAAASGDTIKVVTPMVDAVAQMSRTMLQNAATMRDLMPAPPEDEGITGIVKALAPAVAEYLAIKSQPPQPPPPALPPGQPAAPPPQPPPADGAQPEPRIDAVPAAELLGEIDAAIQGHHDPAQLAQGYLDALGGNPGVAETVRAAGGTWAYFRTKLAAWAQQPGAGPDGRSNGDYLRVVIAALTQAAQARGVTL